MCQLSQQSFGHVNREIKILYESSKRATKEAEGKLKCIDIVTEDFGENESRIKKPRTGRDRERK